MNSRMLSMAAAGWLVAGLALAQQAPLQKVPAGRAPANGQASNPAGASAQNQLSLEVLAEMLRSAVTLHELVENLKLSQTLGPDQHVVGADGREHHSLERTAQTVGAGAGAGAAIGAMTRSQNDVLIGALIGGASGLVIDQIVKQREEQKERAAEATVVNPDYVPPPSRPFKTREGDLERRSD
jgi:hypothetical protein